MAIKYSRIVLKLSGEALAGDNGFGMDTPTIDRICESVKECVDLGADIGIVVGGGNYWRGRTSESMDRTRADHIGMLATMMNSLALADALERLDVPVRVQSAIAMQQIAEPYIRGRAIRHMEKGRVVIFGSGTGNPFFSTDTASALRAAEIGADIIFKATKVDGVYDKDPVVHEDAVMFDTISYSQILSDDLQVMDAAATALCKENKIPILVFNLSEPNNIVKALKGETVGTIIKEEEK